MAKKPVAATPEQRAKEEEVYTLPAEVAIALQSGRKEMLAPLISRIRDGDVPKEGMDEVVRLLGDLIDDKVKLKLQIGQAERLIQELTSGIQDTAISASARSKRATDSYKYYMELTKEK